MQKLKKAEIIALVGTLAFFVFVPFQFGFLSVNASSPLVQGLSDVPLVHEITVVFGQPHDVLLTFSIFMICLLLCFVWAIKRNSR